MSGKKSSEVAAVLKQGEKVRNMTNGIYRGELSKYFNDYENFIKQEKTLAQKAGSYNALLDGAAEEMFGAEGKNRLMEFTRIKEHIKSDTPNSQAGQALLRESERLDSESRAADMEAEQIRRSIMNKYDYCDAEYKSAKRLVKKYKDISDRRKTLEMRMIALAENEGRRFNSLAGDVKRMENLKSGIEDMNETAKKEREAGELKSKLSAALQNIDKTWANKFFSNEYQTLAKKTEKLSNSVAGEVIGGFNSLYGEIGAFAAKLTERIEKYKTEKKNAENALEDLKKLADFPLIEPIEYYNNGENGAKTDLFTYIKRYKGTDYTKAYQEKQNRAKDLLNSEDFNGSLSIFKEAAELVKKARAEGLELQQKMLSNTEFAGDLQNIMEDMGYNTDLTIIDDNPSAGFKLLCNIGKETIDFTELSIDKDGKPVIKIDHTEGSGGNCANSWAKIAERMRNAGIPVTDVQLANGKSVLYPDHRAGQTAPSGGERVRG